MNNQAAHDSEGKEIWAFFMTDKTPLTAEYLPVADKASKETKNSSSEWILNTSLF